MTCTTFPTCTPAAIVAIAISVQCYGSRSNSESGSERFGAADDLGDLLGDLRLARTVVRATEHVEHLAGVIGRVLHGRAAGALLARCGLDQRAIDRVAHVEREQLRENCLRRREEQVVALRS